MRRACAIVLLVLLIAGCSSDPEGEIVVPTPTVAKITPTEPPPSGKPLLRFAVLGDLGSGSDEQYRLADRMCSWRRKNPFDLVLTTGDNIYEEGEPENFDEKFFQPYACLLNEGVQFRAVLGNHDIGTDDGRPELQEPAFGMDGRNYVVRESGVRFVMWDSNHPDREWLEENLPEEGGDRWTVVSFHHPVVTPGPHGDTEGFESLPPLFEEAGVDLVLNGHDHLYALLPEIGDVRYMVTGGGGAGLYDCERPEVAEVCISKHHFLYVTAGEERLVVRAVPISGKPMHNFATTGSD